VPVRTLVEPTKLSEVGDEVEEEPTQSNIHGQDIVKSESSESVSKEPVSSFQTLLRVYLETGRKHQIRAQMAHIGQFALLLLIGTYLNA
jgi:23S rRNA-/tRNA-specific pseudouridylate synthase